ncbi:inorganic pyrophosphatase [Metschnikowia bicuspidata var. bicuspidata NRRL YB-4993]|uniref:inorganic diphosphatase n=1 Tax=Metschnikowia bicuspidata var. bicuspidata NRRL YB-4993 TaxID=869754 RepID=A0A1A0HAG4_9ASCO|nr:inorganic pyrophosphatase [Metschnikowia bicuspidata var. bicuspidata NRRL YB-4993]OBA20867.1 inorganic pyrophosphatase [Metschnikowia bicuspidata var. bicuspidata NRRL YB-4993]
MAKPTPPVPLQARTRLAATLRHLSSAAPKSKGAQPALESPNAPKAHYVSVGVGSKYTKEYKNYCVEAPAKVMSYFHDVPLGLDLERKTATVVVEIPRWLNAKFEINIGEPGNPITQDVKKGRVRFVKNLFPYKGFPFNYGAFPQTWEDPTVMHDVAGLPGDGDPLDVCEIGARVLPTGTVKTVRILGSLALVDDGELDWKVIVVDEQDPLAGELRDIGDVLEKCPGLLEATREWFRNYKLPDGKLANKFAFDETYRSQQETMDLIMQCHGAWRRLVQGRSAAEGFAIENTTVENTPGHVARFAFSDAVLGSDVESDAEIPPDVSRSHFFKHEL